MKVLHLISSGGFYGAERVVIELLPALAGLGCHVTLGVFRNERQPHMEVAERAREIGITVEEIPCRGRFDRRTVGHIRRLACDRQADVIHSHGYKPNLYAWMAFPKGGPKLITTCHGSGPVARLDNEKNRVLRLYHQLDRYLLRRYHTVAAVSEKERETLLRAGVPAHKTVIVNNGIRCESFSGVAPAIERRGAHFLVGAVGRLIPLKNPQGFLAAARETVRRFSDAHFVFVGDGPERASLEALRTAWGLESNVRFLGFRDDIPSVYASLDLFVLPSIDEGMPMSVLESMAAGTPVIATRVGAVGKVVRDGETGLLIEPGDQQALNQAIVRLLEDRSLARRLGEAGRIWVNQHFSSAAMARQYIELYESATGGAQPALRAAHAR